MPVGGGVCGRLLEFDGKRPVVGRNVFIDPQARVMGDVRISDDVVVLAFAVLRGDDDSVSIGRGSVILEHSLLEAPRGHPVVVGDNVLVSHGAIVHGARVGSGSLIGIGARVLDGAVVGENSIVAAGALVPPGKTVPPNTLVVGVPARPLRSVTMEDLARAREELMAVHRKARVYARIFGCSLDG
ncbi:MAG: gamma carbonic anhydrase family protein [Desulfurococcales archaeon]|nr:gamma carbonic anhydrase family protein [Desulfurococcales archaeon]